MSFKLRVILLKVLFGKPDNPYNAFFSPGDESPAVPEKLNGVDGSIMPTDLADLVAMHDVADMRLEARVAAGHGSHYRSHAAPHRHVKFRLVFVAEEGNGVHRQLLLEISQDL